MWKHKTFDFWPSKKSGVVVPLYVTLQFQNRTKLEKKANDNGILLDRGLLVHNVSFEQEKTLKHVWKKVLISKKFLKPLWSFSRNLDNYQLIKSLNFKYLNMISEKMKTLIWTFLIDDTNIISLILELLPMITDLVLKELLLFQLVNLDMQ